MAPAAANYYSAPPHAHHKQRGYRICDTCGAVENPTIQKFRLCGGCVSNLSFDSIMIIPNQVILFQ
jgi:ribosomal protein S14